MNNYQAKVIDVPEFVAYYRTGVVESFDGIFPFVLGAGEEVRKNNPTLKCASPEYCYVGYFAPEYQEKNIEIEYVEAVEGFGNESENIKFRKVKGVKVVSVVHKGPYATMREAYAFAVKYVKEHNYNIVEGIRESYVHGCWDTEKEEDYITEIQVPIQYL